jgi:hypothetical protein
MLKERAQAQNGENLDVVQRIVVVFRIIPAGQLQS